MNVRGLAEDRGIFHTSSWASLAIMPTPNGDSQAVPGKGLVEIEKAEFEQGDDPLRVEE